MKIHILNLLFIAKVPTFIVVSITAHGKNEYSHTTTISSQLL